MPSAINWIKRMWNRDDSDGRVLALFTPQVVRSQPALVRWMVAGSTVAALLAAGVLGMAAFAVLLFALGVIYFLATQVLGLRFDVDPRAFYQTVQQAAQYGSN